jgi:hypothetical protein
MKLIIKTPSSDQHKVCQTEQQESIKGGTTKKQLVNAQTNKRVRPPHMII